MQCRIVHEPSSSQVLTVTNQQSILVGYELRAKRVHKDYVGDGIGHGDANRDAIKGLFTHFMSGL